MVRVAGFRGALLNPTKVDGAALAQAPLTGIKALLARQELVRDSHVSVYRYHQTFARSSTCTKRKTLLVAIELTPWSERVMRPHEETSRLARELASRGIANEAAHTDPVLCGYRDPARDLDRHLEAIEKQQPVLHVTTSDGTVHDVWRESNPDVIGALQSLLAPTPLLVLDGHGRYEGMLAYRDQLGDRHGAASAARYGLACLVNLDDPALEPASRHRVVRNAGSRLEVLTAAKPFFRLERIPGAADDHVKQCAALAELGTQLGFLALFPDDPDAWRLTPLPEVKLHGPHAIDSVLVEDVFLERVLPGMNARSVFEPSTVVKAVDDGGLGLIMRPVALEHALRAAELGQLLPFGSTAFRPPLARLVTYLIDNESL
ncbi:MAG TPA: DUF1015 family protein [Kofleriaceae bacterium]